VINPKTIFRQVTGRIPGAKTLLLSLLLLLVAGGTAFWPSGSQAVHNSSSAKRQRPEFVPGEALVRFKPGRAFEGRANVTLSRKEVSATPFDNQDPHWRNYTAYRAAFCGRDKQKLMSF